MKRMILAALALSAAVLCRAQGTMGDALRQIEENNPWLGAARAGVEADILANRAEAVPDGPEIEFNYLLGGQELGNRHDVRVTQSLDMPTLTGMRRRRLSTLEDLASLKYQACRQEVLLEAKKACIDLVHCTALLSELGTHLGQAKSLVEAFEKRIKAGDATVLDLNKAKVHLTSIQGQISRAEVERQNLLSCLRSLNGGKELVFDPGSYDLSEDLPADFEAWYEEASKCDPSLLYARMAVEAGKSQLSIDKASRLPEMSVGYMSEIRTAEKFRGVTVGLSLPLWNGAAKVKQSRARVAAAQAESAAAEQRFYYQLLSRYNSASALKENSEMMRAALRETDNRDYLFSAQAKGEISMVDYLVETDLYYETLQQTLDAERDYRIALAELNSVKL